MLLSLILTFVFVIPLLIYAAHLVQKIRLEKARRVAELTYRYKISHAIISGIPPQYLSQDLLVFILGESIQILQSLRRETPRDARLSLALSNKKQHLQEVQNTYVKPQQTVLSSVKDAKLVQARLSALRNIISVRSNKNQLDMSEGKKMIRHVNWQIVRCMTDVLMERAAKLAEGKSYRLAIHTYNNALRLFAKLPGHGKAMLSAEKCQQRIEAVEIEFRKYLAKVEEENRNNPSEKRPTTIEEAWEKKYGGTLCAS